MNSDKILMDGKEIGLPLGIERIGEDDLYNVKFNLLSLAKDQDGKSNYQWYNPRRYGQEDSSGFGKGDMEALLADIRDEGLMNPFICRWVLKAGVLEIEVLDGERRYRSIDGLISDNVSCFCRTKNQWFPASVLYNKVPCRIIQGNDKEALKVAFMVSDRAFRWGEGAVAKLIKKLRECSCGDAEILEITRKSQQWLREMDKLCELDQLTFSYLVDDKINRTLALKLSKVQDVDKRQRYLLACYEDAVENHQEVLDNADDAVVKAEIAQEVVEAKLTEALIDQNAEGVAAYQEELEGAKEEAEKKKKARISVNKPRAKTKNLRNAAEKLGEGEAEGDTEGEQEIVHPLRHGKIRKQLLAIQGLIAADGKDTNGKEVFPVNTLRACEACYKAILTGEEDIVKMLKRQRSTQIILEQRTIKLAAVTEDDSDE
jgi:hypothetical protein